MKIRTAIHDDIPAFVDAGRQVHATTRFRKFDFDGERVSQTLRGIIDRPHGGHCFIVAVDEDDSPIGWVIGCMEKHFFADLPVASIINIGVLPERRMGGAGLRLMTAFRKWAENRGGVELNAGVNSGVDIDKMDSFLKRLGFTLTGGNYSLGITPSTDKKENNEN